jgi:hypothetical protein
MTSLSLRRLLLSSVLTSGALLAQGNSANAKGDAPNQAGSDAAWTAVTDLARTSSISKSSNGNAKTKEQVGAAIAQESARQRQAAQAAKEFYTVNPGNPKAGDARKIEALSTVRGALVADATQTQAAMNLAKDFRERTDVPVRDRFEIALAADRLALSAKINAKTAADQSLEWQLVGERLRVEFGDLPELHDYSIEVARRADLPSAVKLATEVTQSPKATANAKARAQSILDRAALVGRPIDLKLAKVDGGTIDLAQQKDKITVIYVWSPTDPLSLESVKRFEKALPPGAQLIYLAYGGSVPLVNRLKASAAVAGIHCQATAGTASKAASDALKLRYTDLPYLYVINPSGVLTGVGRAEEFTTLMAQASR